MKSVCLESLPNEILLRIAEYLDTAKDINAFVQTSVRLSAAINHYLYRYDARHNHTSTCYWAIKRGFISTLQRSLDAGAPIQKQTRDRKEEEKEEGEGEDRAREPTHPIILAIESRWIVGVQALLDFGVDPNFCDDEGQTLLLKAAMTCQTPIVWLLLHHGAHIQRVDLAMSFFSIAMNDNAREMLEVLFSHMEKETGRYPAKEILQVAQEALRAGIYIDNLDMARFALDRGASVNQGGTPTRARWSGALAERLRTGGGGPKLSWYCDTSSGSVLFEAVSSENEEIVRLVLDRGVKLKDFGGCALVGAISRKSKGIVQLLVETGMDVNVIRRGWTALEYAIATKDEWLVDYLRANGAKEWKDVQEMIKK